jgi:TFIIF-interacting CTD phosphatase-like protein
LKLYSDPSNFDIRNRCAKFNFEHENKEHTYWTVFRPDAHKALKFSFEHFANVIVWSAGVDSYVEQIVKFLFRDLPEPDAWYGRSFCDPVKEPNGDILYTKPLVKLAQKLGVSVRTMTIVEDRAAVINTNPDNGILIPAYSPSFNVNGIRTHDDSLDKLIRWYSRIEYVRSPDVTILPKRHIFLDALAPA